MTLDHSLKNTGQKTIDTDVYDHDFFMFDGKPYWARDSRSLHV